MESAVLRAFEDASRTTEGGFRAPNISSVPEKPVFEHRVPQKMRRVPQEAVLRTECQFRTVVYFPDLG